MDAEYSKIIGRARMALPIDLNETPIPSPREAIDDAVLGTASVSICTVCRKGIPVGRIPDRATGEQRREFKCFRCLLKNDGAGSSEGGGVGRFDINTSPPLESEEVVAGRDGNGGARIQASSSHRATARRANPFLEDTGRYLPKPSFFTTQAVNSGFHNLDRGLRANQSTPFEFPPQSPNMLYLQTLREYIAERSGVVGEGWRVEFEFCNKTYKTFAVYIAPDRSRFQSMEDIARHLGLTSHHRYIETGCESNLFPVTPSGLKFDPAKKEPSSFPSAQSCRKRQKILRGGSEHGLLSGPLIVGCKDAFPIQFQDFCLISAGEVDPRLSYHNNNQIWPVGYRSSWHDRITGSLFVCDVADGGVCGPIFKVQRYPCTKHSIPAGSTTLSKSKPASSKSDDEKRNSASSEVVDGDSLSTITLLNEDSPPSLENCLSIEVEARISREDNSPNSDLEFVPRRSGNLSSDVIGEFQVEGRSTSYVWEMVSQTFLYALRGAYKQNCVVNFFCDHDSYGTNDENLSVGESLSRYCYFDNLVSIPPVVRTENEFNMSCQMLLTWLNQDRFGLDADFVQEILEQLPGASACAEYKSMSDRKHSSALQTVGGGFLMAEKKKNSASGTSERTHIKLCDTGVTLKRDPCPPGEPLNSRLPSYLIGDALQVWELAWRFVDVLKLGERFSFRELESEFVSPWLDGQACLSGSAGRLYAKTVGSLLKLLVSELLSKAAVYVCPNFDTGESKSRRGRKKDLECLAALKRTKLDTMTVNGLTWHEIARRYILAMLCMEGNLESSPDIANRESGKIFHCLRGDGGILCGSLTGIAALEADAVILADAMKAIFGSMKSKNEIITVCERESDVNGSQTVEVNDGVIPEWAQVLEPVKKLPTNVGARIRKCINEALEKNPPEWAKEILEHSISKEIYKGNASGPTKRAVISVLLNLGKENPERKPEKKEKVKIKTNLFDLLTKQCRIVLRQAAALDEDRVFCNLLARVTLNSNDNDDEGILGYPAMVSHPLDFRSIDLRLAAGAYVGSHEAFVDDVREVWRNIRTAYGDRSDLVDAAENLSNKFEDLYAKEVLTLVHKITDISNLNDSSADAIKERDDLLVHVCNSSIPRAPWEEGICKVCGMDKDDDNVLLCDKCDSEYHRYCLNPPLLKIPEGNWYCPSCVAGRSVTCRTAYANQSRQKKYHGEFTCRFLEELASLAKLMEIKEFWEFTIEERMFFMKFLFDDALNSATIRDHMDQSATRAADLQHKLRSLTSELKLLKFKEEMFVSSIEKSNSGAFNGRGDPKSDASPSVLTIENSSSELIDFNKQSNRPPLKSDKSVSSDDTSSRHEYIIGHAQLSRESPVQMPPPGYNLSTHESRGPHCRDEAETIKNDISNTRDSIASVESELLKVSLRKDFLGRDSNGRAFWAFHCLGSRPWIIACGDYLSTEKCVQDFVGVPDSDKWMYYESDDEIEKLIGWLRDDNVRERELRESILQLQINKPRDSENTSHHILSKVALSQHDGKKDLSTDFSVTKATAALENKFGPMRRCECLELLWPSKDHCACCHQSFPTTEELRRHTKENCEAAGPASRKNETIEDNSKRKKSKPVASQEKSPRNTPVLKISTSEKKLVGSDFSEPFYSDCPFNFEEIMTRFVVPGSVKDVVNEIGLIGSGGVPTFLPSTSSFLSDPALKLRIKEASSSELPLYLRSEEQKSSNELRVVESRTYAENGGSTEGSNVERSKSSKEKSSIIQLSKSSIICEYSLRPCVGRGFEILKLLKSNLLDMDDALPEDALRISRSNQDRRRVWRAFVKSARSIYEMVQATIVLEDSIKSDYLTNDWWYWSSPSTAAKITTLSALALRVYSLDSAISYDKPLPDVATALLDPIEEEEEEEEVVVHRGKTPRNLENPSSPPLQKTPETESIENPRTRSRSSKRRKI